MNRVPVNEILVGDALSKLKELPDGCVHCVVTSPPYFQLRDYQVEGQIGLEKISDCGNRERVKLKTGLSEDQLLFVVQRLRDVGLLGDVLYGTSDKA